MCDDRYRVADVIRDSFQEYADEVSLVLFSPLCNLKCPTCSNKSLWTASEPLLTIEEALERYVTPMTTAVVFLGGEPTIYEEGLVHAMKCAKALGLKTKLYTNGLRPDVLALLVSRNVLDSASVDVKTLSDTHKYLGVDMDDRYLHKVKQSLSLLKSSNIDLEVRTTLFGGIDCDSIREWLEREGFGKTRYFTQSPLKGTDIIE